MKSFQAKMTPNSVPLRHVVPMPARIDKLYEKKKQHGEDDNETTRKKQQQEEEKSPVGK